MQTEQKSGLAAWFTGSRGKKRKGRASSLFNRRSLIEQLEERRLLVTRVWLDFGDGFNAAANGPFAGQGDLAFTPGQAYTGMVGTGAIPNTQGITDLDFDTLGTILPGVTVTPNYHLISFATLLNSTLNPTVVPTDIATLELSIIAQVQRALEPFDIEVELPASNTLQPSATNTLNPANYGGVGERGNDIAGDGVSPLTGSATVPQFGKNDVYVFLTGLFTTAMVNGMNTAVPLDLPIDAHINVIVPQAQGVGGVPFRLDSGAMIDANYWINRVLGPGGTAGSLNVAMANAALYAIGFDLGLSEVENGTIGPFTNFFDPNVALINQANAMAEAGFTEGFSVNGVSIEQPISDTHEAFFPRFPMMQDGVDFQPLLKPGTLSTPPVIAPPPFPLPPDSSIPLTTVNDDPSVTVNTYDQLVNDADVGVNRDVEYVTGTGAFDQIFITKIPGKKQAHVTVNAFDDNTYSNQIGTFSYDIRLAKIVTPGRADSGQPFRVIVEGCTSDDQVFLDPTLGVNVVIHGGPDVKTLNITGNGAYAARYTPAAPQPVLDPNLGINSVAPSLIPEGLISAQAGTLSITGTTKTKVGLTTVITPFTTTVSVDHFNPNNTSALVLDNFSKLSYVSPGFLNNQFTVTSPSTGFWSLGGEVDSPFFPAALNGAVNFTNVKQLVIDTTRGASNDIISFATGLALPAGLTRVDVLTGTGNDSVSFDDIDSLDNQNYVITPTYVLPTQSNISPFLGYFYSGAETVMVTGTQGDNAFFVTPSLTTAFVIDGQDPPFGTPPPNGDRLGVRTTGTVGATESDDGAGNGSWTFGDAHKTITFSNIEDVIQPQPGVLVVSGEGSSSKPLVKVYDAQAKTVEYMFYAYETTFHGGARVAVADVTGDGTPDIIVSPGVGRVGEVKVYDGAALAGMADALHFVATPDAALVADIFPEGTAYTSGLYVAAGDVNGDGTADIVTSRQRGTSMVREMFNAGGGVFNSTPDFSFAPYPGTFIHGAVVAVGDTNGDGVAEIITAPGAGTAALVRVFDAASATILKQFNGFEATFRNGVSLAAGDVDGDGLADIIIGAGAGGRSRVRTFNATTAALKGEFQAYTTGNINAAVRVAAVDPDTIGLDQIYTVQALGGASHDIRLFDPLAFTLIDHLFETQADFSGGLNIA